MKDLYKILGLDKSATAEEIRKAYKTLAQKYHPDKKDGDEEKYLEVQEAYQILSDPERRAQYDSGEDPKGKAPVTPEKQARIFIYNILDDMLENPETFSLLEALTQLAGTETIMRKLAEDAQEKIDKILAIKSRIKSDDPKGGLGSLAMKKITMEKDKIFKLEFSAEAAKIAQDLILEYELEEIPELTQAEAPSPAPSDSIPF